MFRRTVAVVTLIAVLAYLPGCYHAVIAPRDQALSDPYYKIAKVVTNDGMEVKFKTDGTYRPAVVNDVLVGITRSGVEAKIPLSEIRTVYVQKIDGGRTAILALTAALVVLLIVSAATAEPEPASPPDTIYSCPFVYSHDGLGYILDGEPYGGAICEGLARTDLCELEHLLGVGGEYRLIVANELDETQYIDELTLLVVDHARGVRVVPDAAGGFHTVSSPVGPSAAVDQDERDQLIWLEDEDPLLWVSDAARKEPERATDLRDSLMLTFPKPPGATSAKLVVNACNTAWASQMLGRIAGLWGDGANEWYEALAGDEWRGRLDAVYDREELTLLHVRVLEQGEWVERGTIQGGGPYVSETRVVPLDVSLVEGDELRVMLTPPTNFWTINSLEVDYSDDEDIEVTRVVASSALSDDGTDIAPLLSVADREYYVAADYRQTADLVFPEPPAREDRARTVFARATGYYDIHLDAFGPPHLEELTRIEHEPGYVTSLALKEYLEWRDRQFARLEQ